MKLKRDEKLDEGSTGSAVDNCDCGGRYVHVDVP